ncbi:VOC family protein [Microbacterium sp. M]|uniref:VOC family protein n=1 Tax=Microbacterium sp. M TaxID=3377125 RepID=UPI0038637A97
MPNLNPYLSFRDSAREAMEFYQGVLGGDLAVSTFGEMPDSGAVAGEESLVMHAQLNAPGGLVLMASDTPTGMEYETPQGISVSLSGGSADTDYLHRAWDGLVASGTATIPLSSAPWGGEFGMLVDRFGISWMVAIEDSFASSSE